MGVAECAIETHRHKQIHTQTDRKTDIQTVADRDRDTDIQGQTLRGM